MREEIIFSDLGNLMQPQSEICEDFPGDKWRKVSYETPEISGTMVAANAKAKVKPLTLDLNLKGWHAIYVGYNNMMSWDSHNIRPTYGLIKTTNDPSYRTISADSELSPYTIDEFFWKCDDLTNQSITIAHPDGGFHPSTAVAFIKCVPLTDEEVAKIKADREDTKTKTMYVSEDVDNIWIRGPESIDMFYQNLEHYRYSDVGRISFEYMQWLDIARGIKHHVPGTEKIAEFEARERFRAQGIDVHEKMIDFAHKMGLEVDLSMRMGLWSYEFPFEGAFRCSFYDEHPELYTVDRDGEPISRLSYAYPETRAFVIENLKKMAEYDCDGIALFFNRGYPFILFEEPFLKIMKDKYGVDARILSNNDPRVIEERCNIMTDFIIEVKETLNAQRALRGQKPLQFTAYVYKTPKGCKFKGLDIEKWADMNLFDNVISYPLEYFEDLPDYVYTNKEHTELDIDKYVEATRLGPEEFKWGKYFTEKSYLGVIHSFCEEEPDTVKQLVEVFKNSKTKLYINMMPRQIPPKEYRDRAIKLYEWGVDGIALWDCETRGIVGRQWAVASRLGHKDTLKDIPVDDGVLYKNHNILKIGNQRMDRFPPRWGG